jgi:DNA repair exonuclease SbcCD ATPase subunit
MENTVTVDSVAALIKQMSEESKEGFKELWALFKETDAKFKETDAQIKETSKQIQESKEKSQKEIQELWALFKETDAKFKETDVKFKESARQIKETHKKIGELGGRLGEIIEHIVSPHLEEKFKQFGITLDTVIVEHKIEEPGKGIIAEVDVFLSNGEYAVAVEAKSKPNSRDIDEHVERMKKLRGYADRHNDQRKYLGAIAGMVVPAQVKEYAFKQGFPVLLPSGDSVELECPEDFKPKEW